MPRFPTGYVCAGPLELALVASLAMPVQAGVAHAQASKPQPHATKPQPQNGAASKNPTELRYQLKAPRSWDHWVLAESADTAESCSTFANDISTKGYIESHIISGNLKTYQPGEICVLTGSAKHEGNEEPAAYCVVVVSGKDTGAEGWVATELVELTPESKKIKAAQDAAKAEQQKRARAEQAEQLRRVRAELRARCAEVYKATIDKKINDLTVREEEQVKACRTLGLYPP